VTERIYLASSWRNPYQPEILGLLRQHFEAYDFRNPRTGGPVSEATPESGFDWRHTDPNWGRVTPDILDRYKAMLRHPVAKQAFNADFSAMRWADTCVLLLPSGRSAHLEAGWMAGSGRRLVVYMPEAHEGCSACGGEGSKQIAGPERLFVNAPVMSRVTCAACAGAGHVLKWAFEPELMYLIGGDFDLICTTPEELLVQLRRPHPLRSATFYDPQTGLPSSVVTSRPYPQPLEKLTDRLPEWG